MSSLLHVRRLFIATLMLAIIGCSNKGGREGKVTVVVGKNLEALGVSLVDWRYSSSNQTFGIQLKTSKPVPKQTYLIINGPGLSNVGSPVPAGDAINEGRWIDYGGSKALGNPIANFPEAGTITIETQ